MGPISYIYFFKISSSLLRASQESIWATNLVDLSLQGHLLSSQLGGFNPWPHNFSSNPNK